MHTFNLAMAFLLIAVIIAAVFFGERFVQLPYKKRLAAVISFIIVFGGWVALNHIG